MNQDSFSVQADDRTRVDAKPNWVLVIALRTASLGVAYGLWILSRWLYVAKPVDSPFGICLLVATTLGCAFFLYLGTVAPDKVITTVWEIMGKGLLYILMFT